MKTAALEKFRSKLASNQAVYGLWVTLESASITEMAVAVGLDWVVIDAEHGHLDFKEILEHVRATVRSDTVVLVRIAELNGSLIKRVLDIGADGIVVPWIETADQLRQAVTFAQYPPDGLRGIGAERATCWGRCFAEHADEANQNVLVVPIIETVTAGRNIQQLCAVPGVEVMFFGPADYSSTAGFPGQWEGPGVAQEILAIKETIRRHGQHCGVVATSNDNLKQRFDQGFRMLGLGLDGGLLLRSVVDAMESAGRTPTFRPSLIPNADPAPSKPNTQAEQPIAVAGADRPEVVVARSSADRIELARGVVFQPLVGAHNDARGFTTGIVTFMPGAELPYHMHPHTEAITVMSGEAFTEIEGRRYALNPWDTVSIPSGRPHYSKNMSASKPATFHVAMSTSSPDRTLVDAAFSIRDMPETAHGHEGAECVSRLVSRAWYDLGTGARYQDAYSGADHSQPMCGGYANLDPGSRTACYTSDGDESITVVQGSVTCIVDDREYGLTVDRTILLPSGSRRYLANTGNLPAALVWTRAGDLASRQLVD